MAPCYNEVSRYWKKCSLHQGLRYSEDPIITNYLVNNKNIRHSRVTKLSNGIYTRKTVYRLMCEQLHLSKAKLWRSKFPYLDQYEPCLAYQMFVSSRRFYWLRATGQTIRCSGVNCALGPSKSIRYSGYFIIAGLVTAGFVSPYFTVILPGFKMLFVITGSSL